MTSPSASRHAKISPMNNTLGGTPNGGDAVRQANIITMIRIGLSHRGASRTASLPAFSVDSGEISLFVVPHCK